MVKEATLTSLKLLALQLLMSSMLLCDFCVTGLILAQRAQTAASHAVLRTHWSGESGNL
jgi:hypothetical protein